jgi:TatD DNase family protein
MYLCLDLGLRIGLGGPVTFTTARKAKDVAKLVPLDRVLLETDCPYLAPTPHRGKTNQPGYLPLVAQEIARIKSMPVDDIVQSCTTNAKNLFRLEV